MTTAVKSSLAVSLVILAVFGLLARSEQAHRSRLRQEQRDLTVQATALGLPLHGEHYANKRPKRPREDHEAQAKSCARELIAMIREMDHRETDRSASPDATMEARLLEIVEQIYRLDGGQIRILIAEMRAAEDISDDMRQGAIGFAIITLAGDHPGTAVTLFTEAKDLLGDSGVARHVIGGVLGKWAETNPAEALEWIRNNSASYPDLVTNEAKSALIVGTSAQDPRLAFQLIEELKLPNPESVAGEIGSAARTPEQRKLLLQTLRDMSGSTTGDNAKNLMSNTILPALDAMSESLFKEGFESAANWLQTAGLQTTETEAITGAISYHQTRGETGKWLDWMAGNLAETNRDSRVASLMGEWTRNDYRAAGTWLSHGKDGPARQAAVRAYAKTVAPYDPATAAQWAETLPNNPERAPLIRDIHAKWKSTDAAAANAFARRHGLETAP